MQLLVVLIHSRQFGRVNMNTIGMCGGACDDGVVGSMGSLRHIYHYPHAHSAYACVDNKGFITISL